MKGDSRISNRASTIKNPTPPASNGLKTNGSLKTRALQGANQFQFAKTSSGCRPGARAQAKAAFFSTIAKACGTAQSSRKRPNSDGKNGQPLVMYPQQTHGMSIISARSRQVQICREGRRRRR